MSIESVMLFNPYLILCLPYPWGNWAKGIKIALYYFLQWPMNPQLSQRIKKKHTQAKKKKHLSHRNISPHSSLLVSSFLFSIILTNHIP